MGFLIRTEGVPRTARFIDEDYFIWGASMYRDDSGRCHLYYSRWPRSLGMNAWVTDSEIAHAEADAPTGPFRHVDVALPARGEAYWDGMDTHNPTIHRFGHKLYLYYTGNRGDGTRTRDKLNWTHRNNQRVGVAVADRSRTSRQPPIRLPGRSQSASNRSLPCPGTISPPRTPTSGRKRHRTSRS